MKIKQMENIFKFTKIEKIEAVGNFLLNYNNVLDDYTKLNKILNDKDNVRFQKFIIKFISDWKVIRQIPKDEVIRFNLCNLLFEFINNKDRNIENVNLLCGKIKNITKNQLISLSSKVLFIYSPDFYFPYDSNVKNALEIKTKNYTIYYNNVKKFSCDYEELINSILDDIKSYTKEIETNFDINPDTIKLIRQNRLIDKLLWTKGKNNR